MSESVTAADVFIGQFLWTLVDDSQTANWQNVNNAQSAGWSLVDDAETSDWNLVETA